MKFKEYMLNSEVIQSYEKSLFPTNEYFLFDM